jgi:tRNA/tmRNA/rRNA uracil-C5-methylase (TrmA/RlmC/RlmD family)
MTDTVTITDYAAGGEGVARLADGRVVFVAGGARGDICEIAITKEQPKSCRAEITRICEPSPYRIEPDCPAYPMCGGCDFRHITYEEELRAKLRRVNAALERIGGTSVRAGEILSTGQTDGYRNRAVLHTAGGKTGFYRAGSHEIVPVDRCRLLDAGAGIVTGKVYDLDGLLYTVSPGVFFQVNTGAALLLCQKAREYAALTQEETLVDLYCGAGTFTLFLGRDAGFALGVENSGEAIKDARANAAGNGLENIEFIHADAAKWDAGGLRPDCVTVDPPRKGLSADAVRKLPELSPRRIVYISCDPATMARDIKLLDGYTLQRLCAVDMFPRTANVECVALLVNKGCNQGMVMV